jgi:hypothetical protein
VTTWGYIIFKDRVLTKSIRKEVLKRKTEEDKTHEHYLSRSLFTVHGWDVYDHISKMAQYCTYSLRQKVKLKYGNRKLKTMSEPKIMRMDWRSLGYWPVYKDGRLEWEKDQDKE